MNKPLLISAAAAVILAVVLCTAGCVSSADEIVGNWLEETDDAVTYAVFAEDGTGYFAADKDSVLMLEWKANGDNTYTFLFADGTTKTGTLNALRGLMTMSDGCVLEKQASELSGEMEIGLKSWTCPECGSRSPSPIDMPHGGYKCPFCGAVILVGVWTEN